MYFRQHYQGYLFGSYRHEPVLVDPHALRHSWKDGLMPSCAPFRDDLFEPAVGYARDLYPALRSAELVEKVNGMFSFTPDAHTLIGESLEVRGFWSCEAVWLTHGPGAAQAVAELMVDGHSSLDLREEDLNRFYPHVFSRTYIETRGAQNYREIYDIIHPLQPMERPRRLRLSPFYERQHDLGAVFFEAAGWERPQWYEANQSALDGQVVPARSGWAASFSKLWKACPASCTRVRTSASTPTAFMKMNDRPRWGSTAQ